MLTIAHHDKPTTCTGFLVSADTLVTNSHCIPEDLKYANADCSERLWAFFPRIETTSAETAKCSRIISVSTTSNGRAPDYAFIKLDRALVRQTLETSQDGAPLNGKSHVFKVNPTYDTQSQSFKGLLGRANCRTVQATVLVPYFERRESPVVTVTDCKFQPGTSGSPLIDTNGRAWAIAQSIVLDEASDLEAIESFKLESFAAPLNLATNFSCINALPLPQRPLPSACDIDFSRFQSVSESLNYLLDQTKIRDPLTMLSEVVDRAMKLHFLLDENKTALAAVRWNAQIVERFADGSIRTTAIPQCTTQVTDNSGSTDIPVWTLLPGINAYYQLGYKAVDSGHRVSVELNAVPLCSVAAATE